MTTLLSKLISFLSKLGASSSYFYRFFNLSLKKRIRKIKFKIEKITGYKWYQIQDAITVSVFTLIKIGIEYYIKL